MSEYAIDFGLRGRVAAVTGAAQGIGQAVAAAFSHAGAAVALIDLDEARLSDTLELAQRADARALALACDVGDRAAVQATFERIAAEVGDVSVLVNCAAVICENRPAEQVPETDLDLLWRVNVKGSFFCAQAAARQMFNLGAGRIVNLASQAALLSLPNQSVYTATKGAIAALTRSLAIDWAPRGVTVNAIAPTFVWTPMAEPMLRNERVHDASVRRIPLGRIARPQDIAAAALFLSGDGAGMITGHVLPVDGGWSAGEPGLDL